MKSKILLCILVIAKWTGMFWLARRITAGDLRILAYHGGSIDDEHRFRGGLFMSLPVFTSRLELLKQKKYPVVSLAEGFERLNAGTLKSGSLVITIDDGWYSTYSGMAPALKRYGYCSTLYVATYYMQKQTAVFNVAVDYLMWKSSLASIDLSELDDRLNGVFSLQTAEGRTNATKTLWVFANAMDSASERQGLLESVSRLVEVDFSSVIESTRSMSYMTAKEASELKAYGVDVQLHTHRHIFPDSDFALTEREINENRQVLRGVHSQPLCHFCYPSGEYQPWQTEWLSRLDIVSATTTHPGFNRKGQSALELNRFLDWDGFSTLQFEAEVSGFFELIRRVGVRI